MLAQAPSFLSAGVTVYQRQGLRGPPLWPPDEVRGKRGGRPRGHFPKDDAAHLFFGMWPTEVFLCSVSVFTLWAWVGELNFQECSVSSPWPSEEQNKLHFSFQGNGSRGSVWSAEHVRPLCCVTVASGLSPSRLPIPMSEPGGRGCRTAASIPEGCPPPAEQGAASRWPAKARGSFTPRVTYGP